MKTDYRPPMMGSTEKQSFDLINKYRYFDVVVVDELTQWIPRRPEAEYQAFKLRLIEDGIKEPLDVWINDGKMVVVDGFTRRQVAEEVEKETGAKFPFTVRRMEFASIEDVKLYMVQKQLLERRNLSPYQAAYFHGYLGARDGVSKPEEVYKKADKAGVSARSHFRYIAFYHGIEKIRVHNPSLADALRSAVEPQGISINDIGRIGHKIDVNKLKGIKTVPDLQALLKGATSSSNVKKKTEKIVKKISQLHSKFLKKPTRENLQYLKEQMAEIIQELESQIPAE